MDSSRQLNAVEEETCKGCKQKIDIETCQCGGARGQCDNHSFVPMGCNCHNLTIQEIMQNTMTPDPSEGWYLVPPYTMLQDGDEMWIPDRKKWLRLAPPDIVKESWAPKDTFIRRRDDRPV